jgi:hypothetical protein
MAKIPTPPPDDDPGIADAEHLFRDDPRGPSSPAPSGRVEPTGDDVFDVEGIDLPEDDDDDSAPPPAPRRPDYRPEPTAGEGRTTRRLLGETATVDQVWSRSAEWGPTAVLLAVVGAVVLGLAYATSSNLGLAFAILMIGGLAWVLLSYPIVVTLERPVRITPEQAARDFYAALSHHVPHYRRMWLLLSSTGRTSSQFGSFEGFRAYWKKRLGQIRGDRVRGFTPLDFQVEEFKAEKSAGKSYVDAKFKVAVFVRGRRAEGPLETIRVETGLVKGPDNMWYLNKGTLPDPRSA